MPSDGTSDHPGMVPNGPETGDHGVSAGQRVAEERLRALADLIAGSPHNLVAAGERPHVYERHIQECDEVASRMAPSGRWMDLGTGGGLPGLVLAIRHPNVSWTLVDATAKKVAAVQDFASALDLDNVVVLQGRAESLAHSPDHRGAYDGVIARAVAPMATLAELARGFVGPSGRIVAMKGPAVQTELQRATKALATLRLTVAGNERLSSAARETWMVTLLARGAPPTGYPRRDGVPKSDPLR